MHSFIKSIRARKEDQHETAQRWRGCYLKEFWDGITESSVSMNREFEVAPETMKVPRYPCTSSNFTTQRPLGQLVLLPQSRRWWEDSFFTHHGIGKWMEQNTHLHVVVVNLLCLQSSSLVLKILEWVLVLLHTLAKCLKFWVVMLLAVSFVILMNGTPEGNPILLCLCFMLNYETFGIVWPCWCVFMHFSVCIGVAVRAIVPVYRVSDLHHGRTVLYVFIQQPRLTIAMFLTTKTTLTDFYFQIVLCPILFSWKAFGMNSGFTSMMWQSTALTSKLYIQRIPPWVSEAFI